MTLKKSIKKKKNVFTLFLFFVGILMGVKIFFVFSDLFFQYQTLVNHFSQPFSHLPHQVFSDIKKIHIGLSLHLVENELKQRGYQVEKTPNTLYFRLPFDSYPNFLLPEEDSFLNFSNTFLTLEFFNEKLIKIESEKKTFSHFYLPPVLIGLLEKEDLSEKNIKDIREVIRFDDIPSLIWKALLAVEDRSFLDHKGIDWKGIGRAIFYNIKTHSWSQGGSTLTQQLVKNLLSRKGKKITQKLTEIIFSFFLEFSFSKEKILERYLNEIYFGQIGSFPIHGISQASEFFFSKKLSDLHLAEIALLIGCIKGPTYYSPERHLPRALERQKWVLKKMEETGFISAEEQQEASLFPIRISFPTKRPRSVAPFFLDYVKYELKKDFTDLLQKSQKDSTGLKIYTTLDISLNNHAQNTLEKGIEKLKKEHALSHWDGQGALACVETQTPFIRALIGGKNYEKNQFNRILNLKRHIGSTIKPFIYLMALKEKKLEKDFPLGPGSPVLDNPWTLVYEQQQWSPKNFSGKHFGWMSLQEALLTSNNVIAAKLAAKIGIPLLEKSLQMILPEVALTKVPSFALGAFDLSPIELLQLTSVFSSRGNFLPLKSIRALVTQKESHLIKRVISEKKRIFPEDLTDTVNQMLRSFFSEKLHHSFPFLEKQAAGKTGTSSGFKDAWFSGWNNDLTTVVWVGEDNPYHSFPFLTGHHAALPIWLEFYHAQDQQAPFSVWETPQTLHSVSINIFSGKKSSFFCPNHLKKDYYYPESNFPKQTACVSHWPEEDWLSSGENP